MSATARLRLNESGEDGVSRIVGGGALHFSRGQETTEHASYAWKVHVGIDAPVWLRCSARPLACDARVVVVPPGHHHSTGAMGWSCAVFIAPGSRQTPWRGPSEAFALTGAAAQRVVDVCARFEQRLHASRLIAEVAALTVDAASGPCRADARTRRALARLRSDPDLGLSELARQVGLSLDRLSRLVSADTGMRLRQHVLWSRLLRVLSSKAAYASLAEAAVDAGFADHAHLTRTYRAFLGRAPAEFRSPPDVLEPW